MTPTVDPGERKALIRAIECATNINDLVDYILSRNQAATAKAEKRAYKQGWDSAGGELIKNKREVEAAVLEARIETFRFCIDNFKSKAYILDKYNALAAPDHKPKIDSYELDEILGANRAYELHESEHPSDCDCKRLSHEEAKVAILAGLLAAMPVLTIDESVPKNQQVSHVKGQRYALDACIEAINKYFGGKYD